MQSYNKYQFIKHFLENVVFYRVKYCRLFCEKRNMANSIHISTLRNMLKAGNTVELKRWTKSGEIQERKNCIPLRYNLNNLLSLGNFQTSGSALA